MSTVVMKPWNGETMTYGDLLQFLSKLDDEQLKQHVTVHIEEVDEFFAVNDMRRIDDKGDVLDVGHLYLPISG